MERRLHRSDPLHRGPSKTNVQQLLQSPRPLTVDDRDPPALDAFISASSSIPSESESFIFRQYNNPNAFRHDANEGSNLQGQNSTDHIVDDAMARHEDLDAASKSGEHDVDCCTTSPSTEEITRNDDSRASEKDHTSTDTLSPFSNTMDAPTSSRLLGQSFMDLDSATENLWGFGDFFTDNWGEFIPDMASDHLE